MKVKLLWPTAMNWPIWHPAISYREQLCAKLSSTQYSHIATGATHLGGDFLRQRFPTIFNGLAEFGIDISKDWIPVPQCAHHCGGIVADVDGATALPGLLAAGEVACTGCMDNRLASNSILEGIVWRLEIRLRAAGRGGFTGRCALIIRITQGRVRNWIPTI